MTVDTYRELTRVLQERLPTLAPGQQRIARVLLDDPDGTAFRTIAETADIAGVNQSSLVRFSALLGLKGYPALVKLCQQNLAKEANLINRLEQSEKHAESQSLFDAVLEHEKSNLLRTYARIEDADWSRAVEHLSRAPRIYVMGLRKCAPIAQLFTYLLHLVRPGVEQIAPATGVIIDQLRDLDPDGVFVAMSIRRYTADTVRALKHAKDNGLKTIALTDDPSSPLARLAETTFYIDTEGVTILRSMSVFTSVVQTLATAVTIQSGARSRNELMLDEQLLEDFNVYYKD
ncbi:MurR/RpiR family transcriptional regulator [Pseudarthrobacter enclensis]|uniref:DNA-binding MurR/RpiR family transcriptional regulator n=1 Tax=Pseudarthrobacter enclensis TaxID=993070 RepID=A0ABT9RWE2_9MICC|nr:MurR/RpiR family transcriptional regulator [Pseudarthrobacter enclensis]MDP9889565.1 DNA-binding MurR/RpiR family transcriptional regulator [Pseudarthrobacter enclensis]